MKESFVSYICGLLFALGLGISGMTQPQKIIAFLNVLGDWSPVLLLVMASAVMINGIVYFAVRRRKTPLLSKSWWLPEEKPVSASLVMGAILFGVGWGLAGYCPGPAFVSLVSLQRSTVIFVSAMTEGQAGDVPRYARAMSVTHWYTASSFGASGPGR